MRPTAAGPFGFQQRRIISPLRAHQTLGLIGAGSVLRSPVAALPRLREKLGPVLSVSINVAGRIANGLRAGSPARTFENLRHCSIVLISVRDDQLPEFVKRLAASGGWHGKSFLICDTEQ